MQIDQGFDATIFLMALNGSVQGSLGKWLQWDRSTLVKQLRAHVDAFLNSGIGDDGSEEPRTRHLQIGCVARETLMKWTDLQRVVVTWNPEHGLEAILTMDNDAWSGRDDIESRSEIEAARRFAMFMDSDARWRLVRCKRCGIYALPARLRQGYLRGWHCGKCMHKASATATIAEQRELKKRIFQRAMADAIVKFENLARRPNDRSKWIKGEVNAALAKRGLEPIKRNSISRYLNRMETGRVTEEVRDGVL